MLKHRVIPCLLLENGGLVKTKKFSNAKYVGDPINAIRIFNEKEVDELMVLDISASKEKREPDFACIEQFSGECFMPLCYGGGVNSVNQARQLFNLGVEKVCLQTACLQDMKIIFSLANMFGSQSVMVSIDAKKSYTGRYKVFSCSAQRTLPIDPVALAVRAAQAGAGEILINSVDRDGTMQGYDLRLIQRIANEVVVPLIAAGGAGRLLDFVSAIRVGASAVAAGSMFVFQGPLRAVLISYPNYSELINLFKELE